MKQETEFVRYEVQQVTDENAIESIGKIASLVPKYLNLCNFDSFFFCNRSDPKPLKTQL